MSEIKKDELLDYVLNVHGDPVSKKSMQAGLEALIGRTSRQATLAERERIRTLAKLQKSDENGAQARGWNDALDEILYFLNQDDE